MFGKPFGCDSPNQGRGEWWAMRGKCTTSSSTQRIIRPGRSVKKEFLRSMRQESAETPTYPFKIHIVPKIPQKTLNSRHLNLTATWCEMPPFWCFVCSARTLAASPVSQANNWLWVIGESAEEPRMFGNEMYSCCDADRFAFYPKDSSVSILAMTRMTATTTTPGTPPRRTL